MPVSVHIEGRVCVLRCEGEYEIDEATSALDELVRSQELPGDAELLLDVRAADSMVRSSVGELRSVAEFFVERASAFENRCAILVDRPVHYGLMRMAAAWVELQGVEAAVFRNETEARDWLLG
jgi:hypothetical protein